MAFGVYVHIPYCLQRCVYCDFATYQADQIPPPPIYIEHVKKEITLKGPEIKPRALDTLYFGGGTPSLLEPELLIDVVNSLAENGFPLKPEAEVTMEINPATLNEKKILKLKTAGFNRFSVGAQSFDEELLKRARRKHSAQDTRDTLSLLRSLKVNFSVDLLFALPTQTRGGLEWDIAEILEFDPPHVSPYCLTVPEGHPFSFHRPADEEQVEMFSCIEEHLASVGLLPYEISNFAKPGFESRHNLLYWNDDEYWGVGLSSHSYLHRFQWGCRFWNPKSIQEYFHHVETLQPGHWRLESLSSEAGENLERHQALTDFCHISLRKSDGLNPSKFHRKFGTSVEEAAGKSLHLLKSRGWIETRRDGNLSLSKQGKLLSNQVFEELTFLGT